MLPRPDHRPALGRRGEDEAVRYLRARGYRILARRFRIFRGEVDIIARDGQTLVFVEVKTRCRTEHGLPDESVNRFKQKQVRRIAQGYLLKNRLPESVTPCRFDVLSVIWAEGQAPIVCHYKNAF